MYPFADKTYLHAKIHALRDQFLRRGDYIEIINAKDAHLAFPGLISETDAQDHIKTKEIIFRNQIKQILRLVESNNSYRDLFLGFLRFFEANNFRLLLANAFGRNMVIRQWYDITPYNELERDSLDREMTREGFGALVAGTYLEPVISGDGSHTYEGVESRIDLCVAASLLGFSKKILFSQRRIFNEIMLMRLVLLKILWSRRLEVNYGWDDTRILGHMDFLFDLIRRLHVRQQSVINIEKMLERELDRRLRVMESADAVPEVSDIEIELEKYFRSYVLKLFSRDFHSIYCVVSYLWLLYYQIQNLFRIIEGFRFNVPPEIVYDRIICEG